MNRWKTIAMMSLGFTCGVVWTAACGGANSAKADGHGGARTVLLLERNPAGDGCQLYDGEAPNCCPSGFTPVGYSSPSSDQMGNGNQHQVCLEN